MNENLSMDEQFLDLINKITEKNLDNEIFPVEDLAEGVGLSRSMLHRKLMILTGKPISEYITENRLQQAKKWLEHDVATASEIAFRVGFKNPSYFNKFFKKHIGLSPGEDENRYLAFGIQDELVTELNKLKKPRVIWNSYIIYQSYVYYKTEETEIAFSFKNAKDEKTKKKLLQKNNIIYTT